MEDHGNQLVRTFTGNLTKMLATAQSVLHPHASIARPGKAATDGGAAPVRASRAAGGTASAGGAGQESRGSGGGDWSTSRLVQTFSGPVRRRFGGRSWGAAAEVSSSGGGAAAGDTAATGQEDSGMQLGQAGCELMGAVAAAASPRGRGKSRLGPSAGLQSGSWGQPGAAKDSNALGQRRVERIDEGDATEESSF